MARTKISAHVTERLVNRTALRYTQLDNAQKNNDETTADMQRRLLNNTFWVLDSVGFDKSVIESVRTDALDEANLKTDPLKHPPVGGAETPPDGQPVGNGRRKPKGTGGTGGIGDAGSTDPVDQAQAVDLAEGGSNGSAPA